MNDRSKVLKGEGFRWAEVPAERYEGTGTRFQGVTRHVLLGEGEGEGALHFITRYFEIEPGGSSALERHAHPHSVVVLRGAGKVLLEGTVHDLRPTDCVYVAPNALHQFHATGSEPLGFICIVDRERDTGRPPAEEELARIAEDPAAAALLGR
jgi:quercetin dioxygenase-like cupin family protein